MEESIESEHSGIFQVELVTKNIVLGSSGTHFMYMRVKRNMVLVELSQHVESCFSITKIIISSLL